MKLRLKILAMAVITASTYSLTSCSAPAGYSYQNVSISITSFCSDCAQSGITVFYNPAYPQPPNPGSVVEMTPGGGQGGTNTFVANVTNAPSANVTWSIYPTPNLGGITQLPTGTALPVGESLTPLGTFNCSGSPAGNTSTCPGSYTTASGPTVYYNAASSPPVYSGAALEQANALGIPQGMVMLVASVPSNPNNPSQVATQSQLVQIYNASPGTPGTYLTPSSSAGSPANQTQPVLTVPRNTSYAFYGGVVGAYPCTSVTACGSAPIYTTDNAAIWEVGPAPFSLTTAIPGGNSVYGTITSQGVYTAPATIPTTTNSSTTINGEVVIYVISHFAPTKNSYAYTAIN